MHTNVHDGSFDCCLFRLVPRLWTILRAMLQAPPKDKLLLYNFIKPCCILKWDNVRLKLVELALLRGCPDSVSAGSPDVEDNWSSAVNEYFFFCHHSHHSTWVWIEFCSLTSKAILSLPLTVGHFQCCTWYKDSIFWKIALTLSLQF